MTAPLPSLSVQQLTEQLEELLAKASPTVWEMDSNGCCIGRTGVSGPDYFVTERSTSHTDATLIVALVNAAPELLATLRRLQAACDAKQAVIDAVTELADRWGGSGNSAYAKASRQLTNALELSTLASPDTAQEVDRG